MDPTIAEEIARIVATTLAQFQAQSAASTPNPSGSMKVGLPMFNGRKTENVSTWLFQADEAFLSQHIHDEARVPYIASMLGEAALQWYLNCND
jgi:hypothetical protein